MRIKIIMEKDEKVIDQKHSTDTLIDYIVDLAMECRDECVKDKKFNINLNNNDIVKVFGYAYTKGYLRGQCDAMADMRKEIENLKNDLDKDKEDK